MKHSNDDENKHSNDNQGVFAATSEVMSAYVSNNPVSTTELPNLIREVYSAFSNVSQTGKSIPARNTKPAVPISKSIHDEYLICLEDGKKFKSLKRHLRSHYDLSPEEYRQKWGLPADYPMVTKNYAETRSKLAREMGLGRKPGTKVKKKSA